MYCVSSRAGLDDAAEEFHELRRVDDRIGNAGFRMILSWTALARI